MSGPRARVHRDPPEESLKLYPGLVVHDLRVGGRITAGRSRIPVSVLIGEALGFETHYVDLADVEQSYGFGREELARFLADLLAAAGEPARLLLVLAEAERRWRVELFEPYLADERRHARERGEPVELSGIGGHSIDSARMPAPWWEQPQLRAPVVAELRRCLELLGEGPRGAQPAR